MPRRATDPVGLASIVIVLAAAGLHAASRCVSSGDLWVALACGERILTSGITRVDPFSFTTIPGGWINQNWLTHVVFTLLRRSGGLPMLAMWKIAVCAAVCALAFGTARRLDAPRWAALAAAAAIALAGRPFLDIRPNLHTTLLASAFLYWLAGIERRSLRSVVLGVPALMIPWANLHGGFLFGIVASITAAAGLFLARSRGREVAAGVRGIALLPALAVASAIVSPYGITNLTHPWAVTFGPDARHWRTVIEWMPPYGPSAAGDAGVRGFWILAACAAAGGAIALAGSRRRGGNVTSGPTLLPALLTSAAAFLLALNSRRFVPLFAVAILPVLAVWAGKAAEAVASRIARAVWAAWIGAAALALALSLADAVPRLFRPNPLWTRATTWAERLVRADEQPRDALRWLAGSGARGRMLNPWTWGGAAMEAAAFEGSEARVRIFIDGRAQAAYPAAISQDLEALEAAAETNETDAVEAFLDHYRIDFCLIDRRQPAMVRALGSMPGWNVLYADDRSLLVSRASSRGTMREGPFPGRATQDLTASLRAADPRERFDLAMRSLEAMPTSAGLAEAARIALDADEAEATQLRAQAARACDRVLTEPVAGFSRVDALLLRANASLCRSFLARADGDRDAAARLREDALRLSAEAVAVAARVLR